MRTLSTTKSITMTSDDFRHRVSKFGYTLSFFLSFNYCLCICTRTSYLDVCVCVCEPRSQRRGWVGAWHFLSQKKQY